MPHQCVRCSRIYQDGSVELLKGCICGGRFFFYVKKDETKIRELTVNLTKDDRKQIEDDVYDIVGIEKDNLKPVILDLENIRVLKPGKFEIDLVDLFKGAPLVYKLEDGKYIIDIASTFESLDKDEQ